MKKICLTLVLFSTLEIGYVTGSCCNNNYWCDGDPSFIETPDIRQDQYENFLRVTWSNTYLNLYKCVDFFYVEYCQVSNGEEDTLCSEEAKVAPVAMFKERVLDDWEDPITPLVSRYWANITVKYDTKYLIKVFAVDKGTGWGESEGKAIVSSKPIYFQSRAFMEIPKPLDPKVSMQRELDEAYPPNICSVGHMCEQLARDWIVDVAEHAKSHSLRYHDPEFLPPLDIRWEDNRRVYEQGRLLRLSRVNLNETSINNSSNSSLEISLVLHLRMLRITYWWQSFFTNGLLSLYHTCGENLPLAIFRDVDVDEVEETLPPDCFLPIRVWFQVPMHSTKILPRILLVHVALHRPDFKYDVTWISKHFHNLDLLWAEESELAEHRIRTALTMAFEDAFKFNRPRIWLRKKFKNFRKIIANAGQDSNNVRE
ncbi:hypothetical protein TCAL_05143 [Tigriopus californicus]|uniref:Uncharacterized protein n=1 Tax=Tigriopus californicus TaxID=6832 RepID=A0A553PQL9_TIGCA|nr:uncharacterized protein LOC131882579 [Tigriopus californicus]TRY79983.1 hypothetical protein TCAL_05143 [Tigriopus californicus]|eukprot:TCALIF_05143-PA protein Name:"Protein of unknown function" AED:0.48 eAED:0.48 QI:0/0.6/0.5/0.66/1/1/6/68/425